ncbi:hypothetical protein MMC15_001276 [Xylographa vitiligo]|nr:hypothetical protein [Xylographa vitiligo]
MKIRRRPLPVSLLLLLYAFPLGYVTASSGEAQDLAEREVPRPTALNPGLDASLTTTLLFKPTNVPALGTKDAPVDGKDGRPHSGPFVETAAERDRKKAKESGEEEISMPSKKPVPKDATKGDSLVDSWDSAMPESNDGVMDDPNRVGPKEGMRGMAGGISEKTRDQKLQNGQDGVKSEKVPEKPKDAPPLPHSDQEELRLKAGEKASKSEKEAVKGDEQKSKPKEKEVGGLEKPTDLPDTPHKGDPYPPPSGSTKDNSLEIPKPQSPSTRLPESEPSSLIQPLHSFVLAFTMIIFSEIGDKTFLVAALMAMKHSPLLVFSASFPAMIVMTILSVVLGHTVPTLISPKYTHFAAAALFLVFGFKMLREGYAVAPGEGVGQEMKEVEMELEEKEELARQMGRRRSSITPYMLESGRRGGRSSRSNSRLPAPPESPPSSPGSRSPSPSRASTLANITTGVNNLFSLLLSPAWVQTFVMTFLGEWGDRSQIATIAMAAGSDYWWVTGGALAGHAICIAIAVIGGRAIAGRVSLRVVTLGGAFAFLAFGIIYLLEALYYG